MLSIALVWTHCKLTFKKKSLCWCSLNFGVELAEAHFYQQELHHYKESFPSGKDVFHLLVSVKLEWESCNYCWEYGERCSHGINKVLRWKACSSKGLSKVLMTEGENIRQLWVNILAEHFCIRCRLFMAASQGISDLWSGAEVAEAAEWHLLFSVVLIQTRNVDFIKTFSFSLVYSITRVPGQLYM